MTNLPTPPAATVNALLENAIAEDLGRAGDITTTTIIPPTPSPTPESWQGSRVTSPDSVGGSARSP